MTSPPLKYLSFCFSLLFLILSLLQLAHARAPPRPLSLATQARLANGKQVPSKFRQQFALLVLHFRLNRTVECAASIYATEYLITSARCLFLRTTIANTTQIDLPNTRTSYAVVAPFTMRNILQKRHFALRSLHPHVNASVQAPSADVALIRLRVALRLNGADFTNASAVRVADTPPANSRVMAMSFRKVPWSWRFSRFVLRAWFVLPSFEECVDLAGNYADLEHSMFCTVSPNFVEGGRSVCESDVGSPLFIMKDGVPFLIGVSSFTTNSICQSPFNSYWYTRVSAFKESLDQLVKTSSSDDFITYITPKNIN